MPRDRERYGALHTQGFRLTRRGWGFLVVSGVTAFAAYVGARGILLFVAALLVVLPIGALLLVILRRPRISVTRHFSPELVPVGSSTRVRLTLRNTARLPSLPALWSDEVPWYPFATAWSDLPSIPRRGVLIAEYDLPAPVRGLVEVGPLSVRISDGFGLATNTVSLGASKSLVVTPDVVELPSASLVIPAGDGEATLVQRRASGDDDDTMTREYRRGDSMRRVHWRASARHGDLMVRQEEQRSFPEARLLIDTEESGYPDHDGLQSDAFEWVVRMLASSSVNLRRNGFHVSIEESGAAQLAAVANTRQRTWGDEELLLKLAELDLTPVAGERRPRSARESGPIIALVSAPSPAVIEWMLGKRQRGELAVAFIARGLTAADHIGFGGHSPSEAARRFAEDGWLIVPVRSDDDPAAAWEAIVVESGRARAAD
ncbi:uncharacterized protein (DUF58 family) [Microbacteriaceae bacterium SG_E_30_P1]|uniref:Uncharacterized protein (DUF58 family) n=1 Tax=Antiquaquibacter oligotrophicus TaxID=2880260 RepID=A0ABT6KQT2_9MICO|nr:DUF58 domain-containing protein [Antiquaquibacter oligotrophicus]MDH6181467.1 uncharacterized protein (DUF58 family) [Antiquaquibacter oligotrophicus]UDF12842.1 DUF58 domain-containing protein [Antiquaquibacter oligotrophicus]